MHPPEVDRRLQPHEVLGRDRGMKKQGNRKDIEGQKTEKARSQITEKAVMSERQENKPGNRAGQVLSKTANRMNMGSKYQGALEAVLAIPLGAGLGYWADTEWDISPVGLLIGFGFGFAAFILRVIRMRPGAESSDEQE